MVYLLFTLTLINNVPNVNQLKKSIKKFILRLRKNSLCCYIKTHLVIVVDSSFIEEKSSLTKFD